MSRVGARAPLRLGRCLAVFSIAIVLAPCGVSSAAGAAPATDPPTVLRVDLPGTFDGCDPVGHGVSPETAQLLSLVLPSASTSTPSGTAAQPDSFIVQAEVTSLQPLRIDYQLRKAAVWSDGRKVRIDDFVATWRAGARGSGSAAAQYRTIRSIAQGANHLHVVVTMTRPTSSWHALFSPIIPATLSKNSASQCTTPSASTDVAAGPYEIAQADHKKVILVANPRWWGRQPAFASIILRGGVLPRQAVTRTPSTPWFTESSWMPSPALAQLTANPEASSIVDFSDQIVSLDFSMSRRLTSSTVVRRAISHLIDRRQVVAGSVAAINPMIAPSGSHLLSQGQPSYTGPKAQPLAAGTTTTQGASTERGLATGGRRAAGLFAQVGIRKIDGRWTTRSGRPIMLRLAVPVNDAWALQIGNIVADQLRVAGVSVTVHLAGSSVTIANELRSGKTDIGLMVRPTDIYPAHSVSWFSTSRSSPKSPLWGGYQDRAIVALAAQADTILNPVDAQPLYRQIDDRLWATMPSLPLFTEPLVAGWSSSLNGVLTNPYPPGTLNGVPTWVHESSTP